MATQPLVEREIKETSILLVQAITINIQKNKVEPMYCTYLGTSRPISNFGDRRWHISK